MSFPPAASGNQIDEMDDAQDNKNRKDDDKQPAKLHSAFNNAPVHFLSPVIKFTTGSLFFIGSEQKDGLFLYIFYIFCS